MSECTHVWAPIMGWSGRYTCTVCNVIGYRGVVTDGGYNDACPRNAIKRESVIHPYKCQKHGCTSLAVRSRKGKHRCEAHLADLCKL